MKHLLLAAAFSLLGASGVAHAQSAKPKPAAALPSDSIYQLEAPMTDQSARTAPFAARRGRVQLVSMFYTSCRYICPLIIDSAIGVEKKLTPAEKARLGVTLISMDPKRDNPTALNIVATKRKLDLTRWSLLRPREADVRSVAGVLGVRYRELSDGEFNHTSALVLVDASGRILARTEKLGGVPDPEFLAAVRKALAAR